ncbi:MAG: TorF family putative porin [Desulfobacterales bacterium]
MKSVLCTVMVLMLTIAGLGCGLDSARADDTSGSVLDPANFSATLTLATDYVFRGISQTDQNPAVQGSIDYAHPLGIYAGIWGSNVNSSISKGGVEIDYYAGYRREIFPNFGFDISAIYYSYPGGGGDPDPNYFEGHLGLSYQFKDLPLSPNLGAAYYYSPDFFGEDGAGHYVNGSLALSLPFDLTLSGLVGYQNVEGDQTTGFGQGKNGGDGYDYVNWRIGIAKEVLKFVLDLSWTDTNESDFLGDDIAGSHVVFSVSRTF